MGKPRLIHVGVGGWGLTWTGITSTSPDWDVVAYVDTSPANLETAARENGLDSDLLFSDVGEAIERTGADALLAVVPPRAHAAVAIQALEAGLDVLVEKPLANSIADAHAINRVADAASKLVMVSQNYRYKRSAQTVQKLLRQGFLGDIGYIEIVFQQAPQWVTDKGLHGFHGVGGYDGYRLIEDMSVHHFDLLRAVTGLEPVSVFARSKNPSWSWLAAAGLVHASIEMDNGALCHYTGSWVTQGVPTGYEGDWTIECERGQIVWSGNHVTVRPTEIYNQLYHRGLLRRNGYSEAELVDMDLEDRWWVLREFAACVNERRVPEASGVDNLGTLALTLGTAESAASGQAIDLRAYQTDSTPARSRA